MFPSPGIGDILTICQLVVKIGTILWDVATNDVPQEFQELKEELRVLWEVLQSIKNINDTSLSLDATIALQRIQREANSCEGAMNDFLGNNSPPESKTRRAVWMIRVTKKAALLREKLSVHRQNLGIFWNEFRHQQQADCNKKQSDTLNQLLALVTEHSNGQVDLISQLSILRRDQTTNANSHIEALSQLRSMAIKQAASLDLWRKELQILRPIIQGITLVDAIGEHMEIPFLFCRTYDLLSDVLLAMFKNDSRPGRAFVLRGDYNLVHGDAKDLISSSEWKLLLKPDLTVEMSMILRQNGAATDICPRCRTSFYGDASSGWATCLKCSAQFQIKHQIEEVEVSANGSKEGGEIMTPLFSSLADPSQQEESLQPEWALFRLLSIVSTVFSPSTDPKKLKKEQEKLERRAERERREARERMYRERSRAVMDKRSQLIAADTYKTEYQTITRVKLAEMKLETVKVESRVYNDAISSSVFGSDPHALSNLVLEGRQAGCMMRNPPPKECSTCCTRETPEWRRGPKGPRTLCNDCGLEWVRLIRERSAEYKSSLPVDAMTPGQVTSVGIQPRENKHKPAKVVRGEAAKRPPTKIRLPDITAPYQFADVDIRLEETAQTASISFTIAPKSHSASANDTNSMESPNDLTHIVASTAGSLGDAKDKKRKIDGLKKEDKTMEDPSQSTKRRRLSSSRAENQITLN